MEDKKSVAGFTVLEMLSAITIIAVMSLIYFFLMDGYLERRMSEQAAKVLMLAAKAQEDFFAKEHRYFDAEVTGNGGDGLLSTADGRKTGVRVPPNVVLNLKSRTDRPGFSGYAFYNGGRILHKYDSETGKMKTFIRGQEDTQ